MDSLALMLSISGYKTVGSKLTGKKGKVAA